MKNNFDFFIGERYRIVYIIIKIKLSFYIGSCFPNGKELIVSSSCEPVQTPAVYFFVVSLKKKKDKKLKRIEGW